MEEIRGKTLKEWKYYCKSDNVPIKTMKYIASLEERIEALTIHSVRLCLTCETKLEKTSENKKYCPNMKCKSDFQ